MFERIQNRVFQLKKSINFHTKMCPQTYSCISIGPKLAGQQFYRFLCVGTLKVHSVFSSNFRRRHFTNALLCLLNHFQLSRGL